MASKSELLEAQSFSRRRLLTAFVSGAPGGRELEPAKPMRGVYIGIGLSLAVVLVSLFIGALDKPLATGWENGRLVVNTDTGSRYVTESGTLHPVLNVASARLLLPEGAADTPVRATSAKLEDVPIGSTLGIPGAPDTLPAPADLINDGWSACVVTSSDGSAPGTDTRITRDAVATVAEDAGSAVLITAGGEDWVVSGERRHRLPDDASDGLLRSIGLDGATPIAASTLWLSLFDEGAALVPQRVPGVGATVSGTTLAVGDVVVGAGDERYLVMTDGSLARMSPFGFAVYQNSPDFTDARVRTDAAATEVASMSTSSSAAQPGDWPEQKFTRASTETAPCALTRTAEGHSATLLGTARTGVELSDGVRVDPSAGALVTISGAAEGDAAVPMLVDSTATAFQVPEKTGEDLAKLGFSADDVGQVGSSWTALLHGGPVLTAQAAGTLGDGSGS